MLVPYRWRSMGTYRLCILRRLLLVRALSYQQRLPVGVRMCSRGNCPPYVECDLLRTYLLRIG